MIIMSYTHEEIELTLNLYSIAQIHLKELERKRLVTNEKDFTNYERDSYFYYSYIIDIVNSWLIHLLPDEAEIIRLRNINKKTYDFIASQLGYANHSSVIRKHFNIIDKLSLLGEM